MNGRPAIFGFCSEGADSQDWACYEPQGIETRCTGFSRNEAAPDRGLRRASRKVEFPVICRKAPLELESHPVGRLSGELRGYPAVGAALAATPGGPPPPPRNLPGETVRPVPDQVPVAAGGTAGSSRAGRKANPPQGSLRVVRKKPYSCCPWRTFTPRERRYCFNSGILMIPRKWKTEAPRRMSAPACAAS